MDPIRIQDVGSSDCVTISQWELRTAGNYYELGEFLSSRFANWFPPVDVAGVMTSRDQAFSWRAELSRIVNAGGVILIARHTSSNDRIVGVAVAADGPSAGSGVVLQRRCLRYRARRGCSDGGAAAGVRSAIARARPGSAGA